jgi:hypothetical protein
VTECGAEFRLHDFQDGSMAFLGCDITKEEHAGLIHHDPVYGLWWSRCTLEEHGHVDRGTEAGMESPAGLRRSAV